MNKTSSKAFLIARWVILLVVLAAIYLPLIMIVVYSFSASKTVGMDFGKFTFSLYGKLFENERLLDATKNTLIIGFVSAFIATVLGTTASIGIFYMRRKTKNVVDAVSQITVVNAEIVTAMSFFVFSLFLKTILKDVKFDIVWLIITHTVITTPYVILTVSPRLKQLNPNLLEASMDLGAGPMRSLFTVMIPQLAGAMIAGFALAFTLSLDDFVVTKINSVDSGLETISTYVYSGIRQKLPADIRALSTIIFVVVLTILIVYNIIKNKQLKKQKK